MLLVPIKTTKNIDYSWGSNPTSGPLMHVIARLSPALPVSTLSLSNIAKLPNKLK